MSFWGYHQMPAMLGKGCQWAALLFGLLCLSQAADARPVMAQTSQTGGTILSQEDLDNDGQPDLTIIAASFATPNDRVYVYDGANNMSVSNDWRVATDFEDDTWVFDTSGDGSAQLVIQFTREGNSVKASLLDDQTGDGVVSTKEEGKKVSVTETPYSPLIVTANGSWFLPDGQLNWNVRFLTDGPSVRHLDTYDLTDHWQTGGRLILDGKPDIELEFKDQNQDGIPEYGLWRLVAPSSRDEGVVRTWIWSNESYHRPIQPATDFFWPYLSDKSPETQTFEGRATPQKLRYFDVPPWIWVSLRGGRIQSVNFTGYPIEQGFHVNTFRYFEKGSSNYADFENAQAYYDLAGNEDSFPELHIRHRYFEAFDLYGWSLSSPIDEIRWSWKQNSSPDLTWDYKLGLAGRHTITTEVEFPDFSYQTIPYQDLPTWVTNRSWDYATFVAREAASFESTEGIYLWGAVEQVLGSDPSTLSRYLAGEVVVDSEEAFATVPSGWRGDFAPELSAQPYLYISSIDHKLHLLSARQGVWNIDGRQEIRYESLDGRYINKWTLFDEGREIAALCFVDGLAFYATADRVQYAFRAMSPALVTTLPPRTHTEWAQLDEKLQANKPSFAPDDFDAMFRQFDGPRFTVTNASLHDLRLLTQGFRFVMELRPGFQAEGSGGPDVAGLQPGSYLVTYDGQLSVVPLTPAQPRVVSNSLRLSNPSPVELQPVQIEAVLENKGLEDLANVRVQALVNGPGLSSAQIITETEVALFGGQTAPVHFDWTPPAPGEWQISLALFNGDDPRAAVISTSEDATLKVEVTHQPALEPQTTWEISNVGQPFALILLLAGLGLGAALVVILSLRGAGKSG